MFRFTCTVLIEYTEYILSFNRFRNIDFVLDKFKLLSRFRSKSDPDPQGSIFGRFRRARVLSPLQRLYSTVTKGHGHSEIGENGLRWSNQVRRPRANISLPVLSRGGPQRRKLSQNDSRCLTNDYFGVSLCAKCLLHGHRALRRPQTPRNEWSRSIWRLGAATR